MKPECGEFQDKIARYLLGDLTTDDRKGLEAHLAVCPHCRSEKEGYSRTLDLMAAADNEPLPRHFFIQSPEPSMNPWQLFRMLKPGWQAITAAVAGLLLLAGIGGALGFTRQNLDVSALKRDILREAQEQNRRSAESVLQEVRAEIAHSKSDMTRQQKADLIAALDRMDSRMTGRLQRTETRVRNEAQDMAVNVYRTVSQQRAQDLSLINLRFDGIEMKNALASQQTDAVLDTLLQVAEFKLK